MGIALLLALGLMAGGMGGAEKGLAASSGPGASPGLGAPSTGMEGGNRHSFGPDGEGKRDPRTTMSMPHDAYGNPIVSREEAEAPRSRPRPGAYGTRKTPEAALPALPETDAGWQFR